MKQVCNITLKEDDKFLSFNQLELGKVYFIASTTYPLNNYMINIPIMRVPEHDMIIFLHPSKNNGIYSTNVQDYMYRELEKGEKITIYND